MRISDWSSDVCSSDLGMKGAVGNGCGALAIHLIPHSRLPPIDRLHRPINDRQRPQPEEVELHQAYRLDVVLVELRDRVAAVPLPVMLGEQRAEVDRKSVVKGKSVSVRVNRGGR